MWPANYELDNAAYASVYSHQFYSSGKSASAHQLNCHPKSSPSIHQFSGDCDELERGNDLVRSNELVRGNELARSNELARNHELGRNHEPGRDNGLGRGHERNSDLNRNADPNRNVDLSKSVEMPNRNTEVSRNASDRYPSGNYPSAGSPILHSPKSQLPGRMNSLNGMNGNSFWPNYTSYSNYNQIATAIAAVQTAVANSGHEPANSVQGYSSSNLIHNSGGGDSFRTRSGSSLEPTSSNNFYSSATCFSLDLPPSTPGKHRLSFGSSIVHPFRTFL